MSRFTIAPHPLHTAEQIQAHVTALLAASRDRFGDAVMTTPVPAPTSGDPTGTPPPVPAPPATGEPAPVPAPTGTDPSTPAPAAFDTAAQAEIDKWKALSRKHEDASKSNAAAAKKLQEIEDSNKSDLEKANARADAAEAALQTEAADKLRLAIALKHKIPDGDLDLLGSGTAEEIEARAVRIAAKNAGAPAPPVPPVNFDGGTRVSPVPGDLKSQIAAAEKAGDAAETRRLKAQLLNQVRDKQRA